MMTVHNIKGKDFWLSPLRGLRNGIIKGVQIRVPYVMQAAIYAVLFRGSLFGDLKHVMKQMFTHGRNLGMFILIYKFICNFLRYYGVSGGIESLIAGFVGGFVGFGQSVGISGAVNNQITLYLFARGFQSFLRMLALKHKVLPWDVRGGRGGDQFGFRIFAGVSLALILYMTEYQSDLLTRGFMGTMHFLYYESDKGSLYPADKQRFMPFVLLIVVTLIAEMFDSRYSLESILQRQ